MNSFEPSFLSILPPIIAILLAFLIKDVFISLFIGIYIGTFFLSDFNIIQAFYNVFNNRFINELIQASHIKIIIFTFGIAGFIKILTNSGALNDLVNKVKIKISTPKLAMITSWASGLLIFFDGIASSFLVGNSLRPITDKLRISREKLSYIVDSTSAPIASIAISTWIGTEISILHDSYSLIDPSVSGMSLFINSIPFRFYSIFTIFFVLFISALDRDYGPMAKAEFRARTSGELNALNSDNIQNDNDESSTSQRTKCKWFQAAVPLFVMNLFIFLYMYYSGARTVGFGKPMRDILSASDTFTSLMFGPIIGIIVFYLISFKNVTLSKTIENFIDGTKLMLIAIFILILAWSMGSLCKDLGTAEYLISLIGNKIPVYIVPTLAFIISASISFATGSSWGTMAIAIPILIPLSNHVLTSNAIDGYMFNNIMYGTIGSSLAGACWGDHSSPISDTSIFSAMASGSNLMDHVKTQIPYALTVAGISILLGYLPIAFGISAFLLLPIGIAACFLVIRFIGKKNPKTNVS